jgi:hypothetical protein
MIDKLLEMIGLGGPEHEGKVLAKDARNLVDMIHGQSGAERLSKIAQTTREKIDEVHERGLNDPQFYGRGVEHLTELNRAARQRRDDTSWSGITLAIVYIKAEILGEPGQPARNTINGFLDRWRHATETLPADDTEY